MYCNFRLGKIFNYLWIIYICYAYIFCVILNNITLQINYRVLKINKIYKLQIIIRYTEFELNLPVTYQGGFYTNGQIIRANKTDIAKNITF